MHDCELTSPLAKLWIVNWFFSKETWGPGGCWVPLELKSASGVAQEKKMEKKPFSNSNF